MGNVDMVKAAFEVFHIANNSELFSEDEQSEIKKCQFVVAQIVAGDDEKLLKEFLEIIMLNNNFFAKYEMELIEKTTETVSGEVARRIAKNLKDILSNQEIAERTGLSVETVEKL